MSSTSTTAASSKRQQDDDEDYCFLQVSIAGGPPQKIVIELFRSVVPQTCRNFSRFCGAPGRTTPQKPTPTYRGCVFHRIVPQFMVQAGDFECFNGTGGHAFAGKGQTFADEGFPVKHDQAGIVSMANKGKNTNGSQFFVTLQPTPHLDHKHVAFGRVVEGMATIQSMATDVELEGTKPAAMQKIAIVDCGLGKGLLDDDDDKGSSSDEYSSESDPKEEKRRKEKKKKKKKKSKKGKEKKKRKKKAKKKDKRRREEDGDSGSSDNDSDSEDSRRGRKNKRRKDSRRSKSSHGSSSRRRRDDSGSESSSGASRSDSRRQRSAW